MIDLLHWRNIFWFLQAKELIPLLQKVVQRDVWYYTEPPGMSHWWLAERVPNYDYLFVSGRFVPSTRWWPSSRRNVFEDCSLIAGYMFPFLMCHPQLYNSLVSTPLPNVKFILFCSGCFRHWPCRTSTEQSAVCIITECGSEQTRRKWSPIRASNFYSCTLTWRGWPMKRAYRISVTTEVPLCKPHMDFDVTALRKIPVDLKSAHFCMPDARGLHRQAC